MGLNFIMKKAQDMQKKAAEMQEELAKLEIYGESAGVKVTCDGHGKFKSIKISPEAINAENPESVDSETIETLEDIITTAMNEATTKASDEMNKRMKQITGGIKIPGLNF